MPSWIQHVTKTYLKPGYENIDLVGNDSVQSGEGIEFIGIPSTEKTHISVLIDIIRLRNSPQSLKSDSFWAGKEGEKILIFTETKQMAAEIGTQLTQSFIRTGVLHGDLSQTLRDQTMKMFRSGEVRCVVATNVAARGIDVGGVELVIHSGLPSKLESFLHRR
jgi:superfamily II DNA/RNA helicase